ncbi:MAG: DUF1778 domain-containing protein [Planctomycetota bacterium]
MTKRGPGRPPKSGDKSLTERIEFRATDDERSRIDTAASLVGDERSDWIRRVLGLAANSVIEEHDRSRTLQKPKKQSRNATVPHAAGVGIEPTRHDEPVK